MMTAQILNGSKTKNLESAPSGSIARLVKVIRRGGRHCIVCSRIPFGHQEIEVLLSQPLVVGIILESEDRELLAAFPSTLGYFKKNGCAWQLPTKVAPDMVYVGRWTDFGARAAWGAWRAGIRFIHNASTVESFHRQHIISVAFAKSMRSLLYRFFQSPLLCKLSKCKEQHFRLAQFLYSRRLLSIKTLPLPIAGSPTEWKQGRIVMVGGSLGPGGAERQLTVTLLGLFARGHRDVHFLHHSPMQKPNDFFLPLLIEAGISFSQVDLLGKDNQVSSSIDRELEVRLASLGDLAGEIAAYAKDLLVRRPQIVHVWLDHINVMAGLAALLVGVPQIVLSCRSLSPVHFAFIQPYMRPIYRLLAKSPNVTFLNNSAAGASDYGRWLDITPLKNIQVVRNGFDFSVLPSRQELSHLRSEYRRRFSIPEDAPVVGVIMRISEEKRPLLWLEIARQVAQRIPEAHFLIVGDGPMRDQVATVGTAALAGKIHFPGNERNAAMAIAAMDIFLLTSRAEGLPNVLIEAQALGVVPVAIDVGGVKETMIDGKTGWLLNSSDAITAADKIAKVFSNRDAYRVSSLQAREFVRSSFNLDRMIEQTLNVYGWTEKLEGRNAH